MHDNTRVDTGARSRRQKVVGTRYDMEKIRLLEALKERRNDDSLSQTITAALDDFLADNGLLQRAA